MSWHMSPRYGHVIRGSGYSVLTAVNWPYCECPIHATTRLRHPSLPFDSLPYPTRTICRRVCTYVRSVNHVTTIEKRLTIFYDLWGSATVYVESTWVHYIDFSAIVQVVKVSIIMSSVHVKTLCGQSLLKCSGGPWTEVKPGFRDPEKVSLSPE